MEALTPVRYKTTKIHRIEHTQDHFLDANPPNVEILF